MLVALPRSLPRRAQARGLTSALVALLAVACGPKSSDHASDPPPRRMAKAPAPAPEARRVPPARATPAAGVRIAGTLKAKAGVPLPPKAKVVVMWSVSAGSPDYMYSFGQGTSTGSAFEVMLSGPPPAAAMNRGVFGVGILLLLPADATIPTGKLDRKTWRTLVRSALGGAARYGVIHVAPDTANRPTKGWFKDYTTGYRCGEGYQPAGSRFEGFKPIPCTGLIIEVGPFRDLKWVNWT